MVLEYRNLALEILHCCYLALAANICPARSIFKTVFSCSCKEEELQVIAANLLQKFKKYPKRFGKDCSTGEYGLVLKRKYTVSCCTSIYRQIPIFFRYDHVMHIN